MARKRGDITRGSRAVAKVALCELLEAAPDARDVDSLAEHLLTVAWDVEHFRRLDRLVLTFDLGSLFGDAEEIPVPESGRCPVIYDVNGKRCVFGINHESKHDFGL